MEQMKSPEVHFIVYVQYTFTLIKNELPGTNICKHNDS